MKILVVDDEPQIRRALSLNLDARGFEVIEASTGEGAMPLCRRTHASMSLLVRPSMAMQRRYTSPSYPASSMTWFTFSRVTLARTKVGGYAQLVGYFR